MSEKTVLVIDYDIVIPEGKEKLFEDQHIRLTGGIKCEGRLIFKNCTIESAPDLNSASGCGIRNACIPGSIRMGISGELEMDGCEVIRPGKEFLLGRVMTIQNTSFILAPLSETIITAHGKTQFRNCSFTEDVPGTEQVTHNLMCSSDVSMENCTFENVTGKIEVVNIVGCSFAGCVHIESTKISGSSFTDCGTISTDSGSIRDCDFIHVKSLYTAFSDIDSCRFQKIESDWEDEGVISMEDGKITHCTFDDVELRNGAYLIDGVGNVSVEYCKFTNCRTDRADLELCYGKIETGKLRKTWIEVDILDKGTCTGYDKVEQLD